ncbi:DUF7683 domain-containing protein [Flavobacterium cyanobacteriorum]|nr:hypothetical protein [Flavobacterium cyanobacteriorum]
MNNVDDLFLRVINVYDINSKELKYRIIDTEFSESGIENLLTPYKNDEDLFLRSYEITLEIAAYIQKMYINKIDFDFSKNLYFLETVAPKDFLYSYKEFLNNLKNF